MIAGKRINLVMETVRLSDRNESAIANTAKPLVYALGQQFIGAARKLRTMDQPKHNIINTLEMQRRYADRLCHALRTQLREIATQDAKVYSIENLRWGTKVIILSSTTRLIIFI